MLTRFLSGLCAISLVALASGQIIGYSVMSNGNDHLYRIDMATGAATDLGALNFGDAEGVSFGPGGNLFAIGGSVAEFWDITTPPGTLIGGTGFRDGLDAGLDYFRGTMYNLQGSGATSSTLYTIDTNTGAATVVGGGAFFGDNIAVRADGVAFATDWIFSDSLYTVNLATGAMTLVGSLAQGDTSLQGGSSFAANGTLYNLTSDGQIWTLNTMTGAATYVANVNDGVSNLTGFEGLAMNPVPEPLSVAVLGLGVAGLLRRRRK